MGISGIGVAGFIGIVLLSVAVLNLLSFRISFAHQIDSWRLTRIAMVHAHLMASEHSREEIGILGAELPETLKSKGYLSSAALYDPELGRVVDGEFWVNVLLPTGSEQVSVDPEYGDGMGLPRTFVGYTEIPGVLTGSEDALQVARYALPVVYGPNRRYGLLLVYLSSEAQENWLPEYKEIFGHAAELYMGET